MTRGAGAPSRVIRIVLAGAAAAVTVAASQQGPAPERRQTTATVEFYALGPDDRPIRDLKASELTLRLDGRPRPITALRYVPAAEPPPADPKVPVIAPPPAPYGTNTVEGLGRTFILVVDEASIKLGRERTLRAALKRLLGALSTRDRVTLVTVPHGSLQTDFTTDHDQIAGLVGQLAGRAPDVESIVTGACRTRDVLESIDGLLSSLAGGEGPTLVVFLTAAMYGPTRDAVGAQPPGMCEITVQHFQHVGASAAAARAHFYIVLADDQAMLTRTINPFMGEGAAHPLAGLEHLAGVTGGERLGLLTSAGEAALVPIATATSAYYTASIDVTAEDLDGLNHNVEFRIARDGVSLRVRPKFLLPKPNANALAPPTRSPQEMIRESRAFRALPLRVAGYTSAGPPGKVRIIIVAEPAEATVTLTSLAAGVFDDQGRLTGQGTAMPSELAASPVVMALEVPAGAYRLRAAAVDAAGRSGAAAMMVTAELVPAGPLKLSSLVLGLSRGGSFQPRLTFGSEPVALGYLEIYGGTPGAAVSAVLEVAATTNGPALLTSRLALEATSDASRFTATGAVPLGSLPPGDYVVRAIVGLEGQPAGRVLATLRKN